ncbi:chemokine (C-X-C motif) ligand 11, duplicate 8 isoform 1-T1 [Polymixia lowei]
MKSAVITVFLIGLLVFCVEGQLATKLKCNCLDNGVNSINRKLIQEYEWYDPSPFCPRMEIIVTTREGKKCVNPESKLGKFLKFLRDQKTRM